MDTFLFEMTHPMVMGAIKVTISQNKTNWYARTESGSLLSSGIYLQQSEKDYKEWIYYIISKKLC